MKNTITQFSPTIITRTLTMSVIAVASMLMLGLAFTASAATLTRSLELGMSGSDVSSLQTYLATDPSIYPSGLVTGYFGQLTLSGVQKFQANHGIVSSGTPASTGFGRVGPVTLAAINNLMGSGSNISFGTSPAIYSLNLSDTNTTATFNWNTDRASSAIIYYGTSFPAMIESSPTSGVTIGGNSFLVHTDLRANHSATLTGLNPNTIYYYVVYAKDGSGNESITWPQTFQTSN